MSELAPNCMPWNWQLSGWPNFTYDVSQIASFDRIFLQEAGGASAILQHLNGNDRKTCATEILTIEAVKSAEIEGEILDRDSLRSSIKRHFGLKEDKMRILPKEQSMAELMCQVYDTFDEPLTIEMLLNWHKILMSGASVPIRAGAFRSHPEPMQIVSRRYGDSRVYFEAPPSSDIYAHMAEFVNRYPGNHQNSSILGDAALLHVYFESIHPFEDGNGRIGRALVEKFLSQKLGHPTLIATSREIEKRKKEYYNDPASCNRSLDITEWALFFAEVVVTAQKESTRFVHFLMEKSKIMTALRGKINARQEKALLRVFTEGLDGFSGGLSAENYMAITKASRATTTRDLTDLVEKGALVKTGQLRHTRYWLNISTIPR